MICSFFRKKNILLFKSYKFENINNNHQIQNEEINKPIIQVDEKDPLEDSQNLPAIVSNKKSLQNKLLKVSIYIREND